VVGYKADADRASFPTLGLSSWICADGRAEYVALCAYLEPRQSVAKEQTPGFIQNRIDLRGDEASPY